MAANLQDFAEWSKIYVNWIVSLNKLTAAFDQLICPALRLSSLKSFVEATTGQALAIREALASPHPAQLLMCGS